MNNLLKKLIEDNISEFGDELKDIIKTKISLAKENLRKDVAKNLSGLSEDKNTTE